ncbi:MAG: alanine racemase [Candidatus Aenigmarchaeota archaeon]|nr:alanine racemase [Candidatus Aenigmarchaeota archaeon]
MNKLLSELDAKELLEKYGSPLFIVDESKIIYQYQQIKQKFTKFYPNTEIAYAYKANYLLEICNLINRQDGLAEVISGFEYQIVKLLGIKGNKIIVNGPYKPTEELNSIIEEGCIINADNINEFEKINEIAEKQNMIVNVGIRINAKIGKLPWSKFGFNVESKEAFNVTQIIKNKFTNLNLNGIHIHIGTNLTNVNLYKESISIILNFIEELKNKLGIKINYIDLGGGFATEACPAECDFKEWKVPDIEEYAKAICEPLNRFFENETDKPTLILEPGRYLVDGAISLATSVITVKSISGIRSVFVDAGVNILPSAFYRKHKIEALTDNIEKELTDVYGPLCMNVDLLESGIMLPKVGVGDILIIQNAGAYELSQSMQFTRLRPAVIGIKENGKISLLRRKETIEDIIRLDVFNNRLVAI